MEINHSQYYRAKLPVLKALVRSKCDFLSFKEIEEWINFNFDNDDEGKYYLLKILLNTIFYSKKDLIKLLEYGIYELVWSSQIKSFLNSFKDHILPRNYYNGTITELKNKTCFIPLLDSDKPYESGNLVTGDLVHKLSVPKENVYFLHNINQDIIQNYEQLIIVDDCIGSGMQLKNFWKSQNIEFIKEYAKSNDFSITYLALIGYIDSVKKLKQAGSLENINVVVVEELTNENRIFHEENTAIWRKDSNEREKAVSYFNEIQKTRGVSFRGFKKLDFAVIFSDRIPNWSLPIFHKKSPDWKHLIRRKTTQ